MSDHKFERGLIVFDKTERSLQGLLPLVMQRPETKAYVTEWISSDNEILLWVLAVDPEPCRAIMIKNAADLLGGALEEFADDLGEAVYNTRIATGMLTHEFGIKVRLRWQKIGGIVPPL